MGELNWVSVVLGAAGSFAIGFLWYGPLFGAAWKEDTGMTDDKIGSVTRVFVTATIFVLIGSLAANLLLDRTLGMIAHISGGLIIGVAAAAALGMNYAFAARPRRLLYIDGGYMIVAFAVMGAICAAFKSGG